MIRRNNCVTERAVDFITILSGDFARLIINHHFFTSSSVRFGMTSLIEYRKFSVLCRPHVYLYFFIQTVHLKSFRVQTVCLRDMQTRHETGSNKRHRTMRTHPRAIRIVLESYFPLRARTRVKSYLSKVGNAKGQTTILDTNILHTKYSLLHNYELTQSNDLLQNERLHQKKQAASKGAQCRDVYKGKHCWKWKGGAGGT